MKIELTKQELKDLKAAIEEAKKIPIVVSPEELERIERMSQLFNKLYGNKDERK